MTIVGTQAASGIPPGTIVSQQPKGGYKVGEADPISIEVSR